LKQEGSPPYNFVIVSGLVSGLYFIRLEAGKSYFVLKFIKQ
jgi:hypothetical protein